MADAFSDLLEVDNTLVRKWGRLLVALQDYSEPVPTAFFDLEDKTPVLPATAKQLGFITTDGVTASRSLSSSDVNMLQWIEPVRSDMDSATNTIAMAFGESSNAWVRAVYDGVQVKDFPAAPKGAFSFGPTTELSDYPYYRLWLIGCDGVGDQAVYRIEYAPRAKVTATTDRKLARTDAETLGFTFSCSKDPVAGGSPVWTMENGPAYTTTP